MGFVNLGALYARQGRLAEAEASLTRAVPVATKLVADAPAEPDYQHALAAVYGNLGGVEMLLGRFAESADAYRKELQRRERLVTDHPSVLDYRLLLGSTFTNLGELELRMDRPAAALPSLDRAIAAFDWVLEREARHATGRFYQSYTLSWKATALDRLGRFHEAVDVWRRAIVLDDRNNADLRKGLDASRRRAGAKGEGQT
jgi:tetratricopeptide (TPR) repeat protein